jgi:nucleoside-diphosphate-sugar epimerase
VLRRLQDGPHEVHCLVRPGSQAALRERVPPSHLHAGDLGDPASLREALAGCDWLLHCAGLNAFWQRVPYSGARRRTRSPYYRVNVEGTRDLMSEALAAGVTKAVHVSTVMAYGFPEETPFRETSPPGPHMSDYARSKFDGDCLAWELCRRKGLPLVAVYLAAVVGPGDPKSVMQIERFVRGRIPFLIDSDHLFTYVHIQDAAEAIVRAAEVDGNVGEAYLVGKERLSTGQYFGLLSELSGVPVPPGAIGRTTAMLLAGLLSLWARVSGQPPLLPLDLMRTQYRGSLLFDGSKAERELGLAYTPLRDALRGAIEEIDGRHRA